MNVSSIRKALTSKKMDLSELCESDDAKEVLEKTHSSLMSKKALTENDMKKMKDLLMIYLDYYTYSEDGDVLISDHSYDMLMNFYIGHGGSQLTTADILQTQWEFVNHKRPGMVGSIKKIYTFKELDAYFQKWRPATSTGLRQFVIAPKYDGISSAIEIEKENGILLGVTRNDGFRGMDITSVIKNSENGHGLEALARMKLQHDSDILWVKTELVITTSNFNKLIQEKKYANRRSATSGIVNTPSNLNLAKYITILPLAYLDTRTEKLEYDPRGSRIVTVNSTSDLMNYIEEMLLEIRDADYDIRTDGVVIYPIGHDVIDNYDDIMDNAIAFKVNTEEAFTKVLFGYVSVGRLGRAVPMLHVPPTEVNETIVEDVSLGSFDKFVSMDLHEGERVLVYSAGDVIPQAKLPEKRKYKKKANLLKIELVCPYCGKELTRYKALYSCTNKNCPRVRSGRITNFITKLGVENVSDQTIEDLMNANLIGCIPDIFYLKKKDIMNLEGYGSVSAEIIIKEFEKLREREIPISDFLGALGIQGIAKKKCRKIVKQFDSFDSFLTMKPYKLKWQLVDGFGIGMQTAMIFIEFIDNNRELIEELLDNMNIVKDVDYIGNVVFTGFRDAELESKFNDIGYEVSSSVTNKTVAVIDSSYEHTSGSCKNAKRKGIDIVHRSMVEEVLESLSKSKK